MTDIAHQEIIELHRQIESLFGGTAEKDALDALVACFDAGFRMVTVRGDRIDRDGVATLFASLRGARPGIHIDIADVVTHSDADGLWVSYTETQTLGDGSGNRRHSTAWLMPVSGGRPVWRYLHETLLP